MEARSATGSPGGIHALEPAIHAAILETTIAT
jgi:hypothetical protein